MEGTSNSLRMLVSYWISQTVYAMVRYFASIEIRETIGCFFDFHEIKELGKYMQ